MAKDASSATREGFFSNILFLIPFGRYLGDRRRDEGDEGLLIGRLKQRAGLIGALMNDTFRGGILVTGHRGSGKTTLVNHCLEEYQHAVYERYLNRNVGKQMLWDGVAFLGFAVFGLLLLALGREVLGFLVSSGRETGLLRSLVAAGITLFLLQPFLFAWSALRGAVALVPMLEKTSGRKNHKRFQELINFFGLIMVLALGFVVCWISTGILPAAAALLLLSSFFLFWHSFVYLLPFRMKNKVRVILLVMLALGSLCWAIWLDETPVVICLVFACLLGVNGFTRYKLISPQSRNEESRPGNLALRMIIGGAVLAVPGIAVALEKNPSTRLSCLVLLLIGLCSVMLTTRREGMNAQVSPGPFSSICLLLLKALLMTVLGLQAISPLVQLAMDTFGRNGEGEVWATWTVPLQKFVRGSNGDFDENLGFWLLASTIHFALLVFWEFEWIVRRTTPRRDRSLQVDGTHALDGTTTSEPSAVRHRQKMLFEQTFFYLVFRQWIPVLVVPVNLGLDTLDHRRVIEAMLTGLRNAYHSCFCSRASPIRFARTILVLLISAILALIASYQLFAGQPTFVSSINAGAPIPDINFKVSRRQSGAIESPASMLEICRERTFNGALSAPGAVFACWLGKEPFARLLYSPLTPQVRYVMATNEGAGMNAVAIFLRSHLPWWEVSSEKVVAPTDEEFFKYIRRPDRRVIVFRVYHLVTFLVIWISVRLSFRKFWPFDENLRRIDAMVMGLSGRLRQEPVNAESIWSRIIGVIAGRDRDRFVESEIQDPRTVEVATLDLLGHLQELRIELPFLARHHLSLPAPEIIFKFDELDKLGIGVIPERESAGPEVEPAQGLDLERRRSRALHNLFADMKNLVGAGVARFIFIGGRNLHDEWLADLSDRRPLLTNIFTTELHLPSLLTEGIDGVKKRDDDVNIRWFVLLLADECRKALNSSSPPELSLGLESSAILKSYSYTQTLPEEVLHELPGQAGRRYLDVAPFGWEGCPHGVGATFFEDFIDFLCYRSRGNPRRLRMLIESFLDLRDRVQKFELAHYAASSSRILTPCDHILVFREVDRYRIQLISEIYRRFHLTLGRRFSYRDDKLIVGALYVADFLLKFHRRAFGWSNLQRVDELVNIHRSPDLPQVLSQVLTLWTGRYLHRIRNGMYDYRFNGELAQELRYLSRRSEEELAALNFTLDESQELKTIYKARYRQLKEDNSWEFVAALGELHEFDEEYEIARFYYHKAISYLDSRLERQLKMKGSSALFEVLTQSNEGFEVGRRRINWALARLRVNLQIGMSYERSDDLEQAQVQYRSSRTYASAITRALLNAIRVGKELILPRPPDSGRPDFTSTLKHMNLLFQPVFAEAWVAEKQRGGIDTSMRIVERSLWEIRWLLPAVSDEFDEKNAALRHGGLRRIRFQHLNFYLTMAEQHNKAGDLLFYKASPVIRPGPAEAGQRIMSSYGGFLGRAHYHYALSIQELHAFIAYRRERNIRLQYDDWDEVEECDGNEHATPWADFVFDAAGDSLADLADTLASRSSLADVLGGTWGGNQSEELVNNASAFFRQGWTLMKSWLEVLPGLEADTEGWALLLEKCFPGMVSQLELAGLFGRRVAAVENDMKGRVIRGSRDHRQRMAGDRLYNTEFRPASSITLGDQESMTQRRHKAIGRGDVQSLIYLPLDVTSREAVANYMALLAMSSAVLEDASRPEDAARKASRLVEAAQAYVAMGRFISVLNNALPYGRIGLDQPMEDWSRHFSQARKNGDFLFQVAAFGVAGAERACSLYLRARHDFQVGRDGFSPGRLFPTQLAIHLCALALHLIGTFSAACPLVRRIAAILRQVLLCQRDNGLLGGAWQADLAEVAGGRLPPSTRISEVFVTILEDILRRNAYPVLGRLHGLKVLLDNRVLEAFEDGRSTNQHPEADSEASRLLAELVETEAMYDAPLHFTPFLSGTTQAFYALACCWGRLGMPTDSDQAHLLRQARRVLATSIGMFTMKDDFFKVIGKSYYLYDDFTDRRTHFNHAMQIVGAELTEFLLTIIDRQIISSRSRVFDC